MPILAKGLKSAYVLPAPISCATAVLHGLNQAHGVPSHVCGFAQVVSVFGRLLTVRQAVIRINNRVFDTGVAAMDKQQYKVMPDEGAEHCRNTLSWWR